MPELLKNAFTGGNLIPTVLLILIVLYWLIAIIGAIGFDILDLDFDLDLDFADGEGPFYALFAFLKVGELPLMFVVSIIILNFWIIAMFMYYLPIPVGGRLNSILLIPAFILSVFITRVETFPLRLIFRHTNIEEVNDDLGVTIIGQLCTLKCPVEDGRLGQAEIERDGAPFVINVKAENEGVSFRKNETAFVIRKDLEKDLYYIVKNEGVLK